MTANLVHPENTRLPDLLADRALVGLSTDEQVELNGLLRIAESRDPPFDAEALDRAAASVALAYLPPRMESPPPALQAAIFANAAKYFADRASIGEPAAEQVTSLRHATAISGGTRSGAFNLRRVFAWSAVAASLLIGYVAWETSRGWQPVEITLNDVRETFLKERPDALELAWTATADPAGVDAGGDVVWSNAAQTGYMRFQGLEKNDPRKSQYQLWIFDADQDERYPIDGGVFDIAKGGCEAIVPITAKLRVGKPVMFAVTVEKPGGVVVSSRERIAVLAKVAGK